MFLDKYVNNLYLELIYSNYDQEYLSKLDESKFLKVYQLLNKNGFYYLEDIIVNYLELFEIDVYRVEKALIEIEKLIGEDYVSKIGKNMSIINEIIRLSSY